MDPKNCIIVNDVVIDVRRDDIASAIAETFAVPIKRGRAKELNQQFAVLEHYAAGTILRPMKTSPRLSQPIGKRFFYQLLCTDNQTPHVNVNVFTSSGDSYVGHNTYPVDKPPGLDPFRLLHRGRNWPSSEKDFTRLEIKLLKKLQNEDVQRTLIPHEVWPTPFYANEIGEQHAALHEQARHKTERSTAETIFRGLARTFRLHARYVLPVLLEQNEDYFSAVNAALKKRLAIQERVAFENFYAHLDANTIAALKACKNMSGRSYQWIQQNNSTKRKYRQQFVAAMPLFAHLALNIRDPEFDKNCRTYPISASVLLDRLIDVGREMLAPDANGAAGAGLQCFAQILCQDAKAKGVRLSHEKPLRHPRALASLAKIDPYAIDDWPSFFSGLEEIFDKPSAQFPKTTAEWVMAAHWMRHTIPLAAAEKERMSAAWGTVACKVKAKITKAQITGAMPEKSVLDVINNTKDYHTALMRDLIWPSINLFFNRMNVEANPGYLDTRHIRERVHSLFTYEQLLDSSIRYHTPHILGQVQATLFRLSRNSEEAIGWLPLTMDFTIPKGTFFHGKDLGGTEIAWLTTPAALKKESLENANCVDTYVKDCINHGVQILRITAPKNAMGQSVRSTAELRPFSTEGAATFRTGQNMAFGDQRVPKDSVNDLALEWLAQKLHEGQRKRAATPGTVSETPAAIDPATGLPDFARINLEEAEAQRKKLKLTENQHSAQPYDPHKEGAVQAMLDTYRRQGILPNRLRHAQTPEELLGLLGITKHKGQLVLTPLETLSAPQKPPRKNKSKPETSTPGS